MFASLVNGVKQSRDCHKIWSRPGASVASLRSIVMQMEFLSPEAVMRLELTIGVPIVYEIDVCGQVIDKAILDH
jgi:hypothetical protein